MTIEDHSASSDIPRSRAATFDWPGLGLAVGAAFLAGATDVVGLSRLKDIFVFFMSGNTTLLGIAIGHADWPHAGLIAGVVALFVVGAAGGGALAERTGRHHAAAVMGVVAGLLAVPLVSDALAVPALALAMGALNDTMSKIGATGIGLTYVTGALVKLGSGVGHRLAGHRGDLGFLLQAPLWLSLLAGAIAAALAQGRVHGGVWPLPLLAAALVPLCLRRGGTGA